MPCIGFGLLSKMFTKTQHTKLDRAGDCISVVSFDVIFDKEFPEFSFTVVVLPTVSSISLILTTYACGLH